MIPPNEGHSVLAGQECSLGTHLTPLLQSSSPSPPESLVEEEHSSSRGGNGKPQRAEDKDLSGPYVSSRERQKAGVDRGGPGLALVRSMGTSSVILTSVASHSLWSTCSSTHQKTLFVLPGLIAKAL